MTVIPIAEFAPDMPDLPSGTSDAVYNVVPVTVASYGPQRNLSSYSAALTARCQGGISMRDNAGAVRVFAGDATKLYRMPDGTTTFADVKKVGGYSTSSEINWSFTQFGLNVIATNYNDPPQSYVEGSSALFADLITSGTTSLKAKYSSVVKDFLVLANTTDGTYGTQTQRVWWSAVNDPTNFPTPGTSAAYTALSDFQDLVGEHGEINGIAGNLGTADAAVFLERAVYRMVYSGMPNVFSFAPAEGAIGLIAPGGLTQFSGMAYYIAEDGFRVFDGSSSRAIGKNKVDRFFYNELDSAYLTRVTSAVDAARGLIFFGIPTTGSGGVVNRLYIYNVYLDRWTITEIDAVRLEILLRSATFSTTLEQLDSIATLDALSYSLDSQVWIGGRNRLAAFDTSHKFGYFDGSYLAAKVDTSDYEVIPGRQSLVNFVRPLTDTASATVATATRDRLQDALSYSSESAINRTGLAPVRARGRIHRARITVPASTDWNYISGIEVEDAQALGKV